MTPPTPEQERKAVMLLIAGAISAAIGAAVIVALCGVVLGLIAKWVFA